MQIVPGGNKRRLFFETDREPSFTVTYKALFHPFILQKKKQKQNKKSEKRGLEAEEREARKLEARNVQGC